MSQWEVVAPRTYLQEVAANPPPGMYSMQATLPRLPVPDLDGTLDKVRRRFCSRDHMGHEGQMSKCIVESVVK